MGSPGVYCVKSLLASFVKEQSVDFVIANADGATGGFGLGKNHSIYLHKLGINAITSGECIYYKLDMVEHLRKTPFVLRCLNYPYGNPGRGWAYYSAGEQRLAVINLLGQSGFQRVHLNNPFLILNDLVEKIVAETRTILVDFHACTTAEKSALFYYLDGKVSAVLGSHTKVLSADERIFPGGTAVISGTGRTGSQLSVGGFEPEVEIRKYLTQIHENSRVSWENLELQGVLLTINGEGRAVSIERVRLPCQSNDGAREAENP